MTPSLWGRNSKSNRLLLVKWSSSPRWGLDASSPSHILRMFPEQLLIGSPRKIFTVRRKLGTISILLRGRFIFKVADGKMEYRSSLQAFICLVAGQGSRNALYQPQEDYPTAKVSFQRRMQCRHAAAFLFAKHGTSSTIFMQSFRWRGT